MTTEKQCQCILYDHECAHPLRVRHAFFSSDKELMRRKGEIPEWFRQCQETVSSPEDRFCSLCAKNNELREDRD